MSILPPLLFGISASLDALLVGMALGLQKVPLPARHNLLISTVTLIGTVISIGLFSLSFCVITLCIDKILSDLHHLPSQCTDPFRSLLRGKMAAFQMVLQFFPG